MFLNPIEVPEIRLNRTPFKDSLGSLQTSISHWTRESVLGSPWTQSSKNFSLCSKSHPFLSRTFRISCMISLGSREEVVFILHVNRRDRGFTASSLEEVLFHFKNKNRLQHEQGVQHIMQHSILNKNSNKNKKWKWVATKLTGIWAHPSENLWNQSSGHSCHSQNQAGQQLCYSIKC